MLNSYWDICQFYSDTEKKSVNFKNAVCEVFHKSLRILLEPLLSTSSINLYLNNERIQFYPRISIIIADWPEAATYCLTYKLSMSNFICYFCLVAKNDLANINLQNNEIILRTHINMRQNYDQNLGNSVCIENVYNIFWDLP